MQISKFQIRDYETDKLIQDVIIEQNHIKKSMIQLTNDELSEILKYCNFVCDAESYSDKACKYFTEFTDGDTVYTHEMHCGLEYTCVYEKLSIHQADKVVIAFETKNGELICTNDEWIVIHDEILKTWNKRSSLFETAMIIFASCKTDCNGNHCSLDFIKTHTSKFSRLLFRTRNYDLNTIKFKISDIVTLDQYKKAIFNEDYRKEALKIFKYVLHDNLKEKNIDVNKILHIDVEYNDEINDFDKIIFTIQTKQDKILKVYYNTSDEIIKHALIFFNIWINAKTKYDNQLIFIQHFTNLINCYPLMTGFICAICNYAIERNCTVIYS